MAHTSKTKPPATAKFSPTPEQQAILDAGVQSTTSMMISAYAGCAKTSTIEMLSHKLPTEPTLALAFNVKIKKELEERLPAYFEVKTLNGLGHSAWSRAIGKRLTLEQNKLGTLITKSLREAKLPAPTEVWVQLKSLVTGAMQAGLVATPFPYKGLLADTHESWVDIAEDFAPEASPETIDFARFLLIEHTKMAFGGVVSFDDQIYCSALLGGVFPRFPRVIVDEAQDLSPLQHLMLRKTAAGRLIVVGDPQQAIYGFRGADTASMAKIKALREEWVELPLALTFRCPQAVVSLCAAHAPGFTAHPSNKKGLVTHVKPKDPSNLAAPATWTTQDLFSHLPNPTSSLAILSRNNAPLFSMAFKLIRSGIGCVMLGRDLGKGLVALSKKLFPLDDTPLVTCASAVHAWAEQELSLARANGREGKLDSITDKSECLIAVIESSGAKDAKGVRDALERLFTNEVGRVTLATGHRAKGLEWDCVLHLDPWRCPSKWAKTPAALEQEHNLQYVIHTRTKNVLLFGNLADFTP